MSIFKPINPDRIGYADRFECIKCGGWIQWHTYTKDIDEFNYCPYCGEANPADDPEEDLVETTLGATHTGVIFYYDNTEYQVTPMMDSMLGTAGCRNTLTGEVEFFSLDTKIYIKKKDRGDSDARQEDSVP